MIINVIIFLVCKGAMVMFGGIGKNFGGLRVCFFKIKKIQAKKFTRLPYFTLLLSCVLTGF